MINLAWEKLKAIHELIFVTTFNRYQGLVLFLMLLAIYYKQIILVLRVLQEALTLLTV